MAGRMCAGLCPALALRFPLQRNGSDCGNDTRNWRTRLRYRLLPSTRRMVRYSTARRPRRARWPCCLRTRARKAHPAFVSRAGRCVVLAAPVARAGHCRSWRSVPPPVADPILGDLSRCIVGNVCCCSARGFCELPHDRIADALAISRLSFDALWRSITADAMYAPRRVVDLLRMTH